jgi:signal transduction histidine kinase
MKRDTGLAVSGDDLSEEALATVAHELRTPVQTIAGWAELLQRGTLDARQSARALETIVRTTALQSMLIDDLLDRTRIRRGELALKREWVDMASLVARVCEAMLPIARAKDIEIDVGSDGAVCDLLGDAARLEQVMRNLLANAVKFSPRSSRIEVLVTKLLGKVRATVKDSGIGIRRELLPNVFELFRRGDSGHPQRGLGLGLAIARRIVELHGGRIYAASDGEGKGSTLSVILPLSSVEERAAPRPS